LVLLALQEVYFFSKCAVSLHVCDDVCFEMVCVVDVEVDRLVIDF